MYSANVPSQAPVRQPVTWGGVLLGGLGAIALWKFAQYVTDEDFGDGEYPRGVRRELIDEHIAAVGCCCPMCGRRVQRSKLSVDHIWPMSKGGRTSINNAQVICMPCNSRKSSRMGMIDALRGRGSV